MKRSIWLFLFLFIFSSFVFAQTKIDKYCDIIVGEKGALAKNKTTLIILSYGNNDSLFSLKDSSEISKLKAVNSLTSAADVLNYMSLLGWKIIAVIPYPGLFNGARFYFKKEFDNSELK